MSMSVSFHRTRSFLFRKGSAIVLALSWSAGLFSGAFAYPVCGGLFTSLMRGLPFSAVSIVGRFLSAALPFLFSALAVSLSQSWLLFLIGYGKSFLSSFLSLSLILGFGSAGWLFRLLSMFTGLASLPLLYLYQHRLLSHSSHGELPAALSLLWLIGSVDSVYILPFLADMINS